MIAQIIYLVIVFISTIILVILENYILKLKGKKQLHKFFMYTMLFLIVYNIGCILLVSSHLFFNYKNICIEYICFLGVTFCSAFFLLVGLAYVKQNITFNYKYIALFIPPILTNIVLWTNQYHRLFYKEYGSNIEYSFGPYFYIAMLFTWLYILIGISYLISFSIKNSGFFSKQTKLLILGTIVPMPFNVSWILGGILKIEFLKFYSNYDISPITLTITVICYALAIFKFDFLNVVPIALQKVVDHISDCFVVINEDFQVIDYNKPFTDTFNGILNLKRKDNFIKAIKSNEIFNKNAEELEQGIKEAISKKESVSSETHITSGFLDMHFRIEITPIISNRSHIGTIILLKDITEIKHNLEKVQNTQKQLIDRERLASLGELIGGVAHDINSPLASLQNFAKEILNLTKEYNEAIGDPEVTPEDHKEIAGEIKENIDRILNVSNRIATIVNSVRNHTRNLSGTNFDMVNFRIVIEDLKILLGHELKHRNCELIYKEDKNTTLTIDQGKLGQVMTNVINNAIQAYDGVPGIVEVEAKNTNNEVFISVKDYGKGIDPAIKDGIFKEILSTKGTKGTGMGLFISYMIITGHFGGKMWLESELGKGTTINLAIPKYNPNSVKVG